MHLYTNFCKLNFAGFGHSGAYDGDRQRSTDRSISLLHSASRRKIDNRNKFIIYSSKGSPRAFTKRIVSPKNLIPVPTLEKSRSISSEKNFAFSGIESSRATVKLYCWEIRGSKLPLVSSRLAHEQPDRCQ
jgi:hypothetical protein